MWSLEAAWSYERESLAWVDLGLRIWDLARSLAGSRCGPQQEAMLLPAGRSRDGHESSDVTGVIDAPGIEQMTFGPSPRQDVQVRHLAVLPDKGRVGADPTLIDRAHDDAAVVDVPGLAPILAEVAQCRHAFRRRPEERARRWAVRRKRGCPRTTHDFVEVVDSHRLAA